jgi:hypothetical protein
MQNNDETTKKHSNKQSKNDTSARKRRSDVRHPAMSNVSGEAIGPFHLGEVGSGEAKLAQHDDHILIGFEITSEVPELSIDLVVGPPNWDARANVYEVKSVPVVGGGAIFEIERADLAQIAQDGRVQFYARVHTPTGETHFLNREGRAFENFEIRI